MGRCFLLPLLTHYTPPELLGGSTADVRANDMDDVKSVRWENIPGDTTCDHRTFPHLPTPYWVDHRSSSPMA